MIKLTYKTTAIALGAVINFIVLIVMVMSGGSVANMIMAIIIISLVVYAAYERFSKIKLEKELKSLRE